MKKVMCSAGYSTDGLNQMGFQPIKLQSSSENFVHSFQNDLAP